MRRALLRRFPYAVFFEVGRTEIVVYVIVEPDEERRLVVVVTAYRVWE